MRNPIVPTAISKVFEGRVLTLQIETIALPKGGELRAEVVRHPGSVVLVPVTDVGEIVLVRQYRHAIGRDAWELPAGSLKPGEEPEAAARRECQEETGLIPSRLDRLGAFFPTPGYCDEEMAFYLATGLRQPAADDSPPTPDDDEDIESSAFAVDEVAGMIETGRIVDLKTVAGMWLLQVVGSRQ